MFTLQKLENARHYLVRAFFSVHIGLDHLAGKLPKPAEVIPEARETENGE